MKFLCVLLPFLVTFALADDDDLNPLSDEFINIVNSKATTWKVS